MFWQTLDSFLAAPEHVQDITLNHSASWKHVTVSLHAPVFAMPVQGVSKRVKQCRSKRYCVVNVTKTFTFKGVQTIHRSTT
jgi:hypothetical protein